MADDMKLFVIPGDQYAGSFDPESLQVLTYLKLTKKSSPSVINVVSTCKSWQSPSGLFPTLLVNGKTYIGSYRIIQELKKHGLTIDDDALSDLQTVDMMAYSALLTDHLRLAMVFAHWMDSKNYTEFTRQWYGRTVGFPVSQYLVSRNHNLVKQKLKTCLPEETSMDHRGITLMEEAEQCLNMLSSRLKDKTFFFGESLSTMDAMVFGYLEIISQYPLPGNNKLMIYLNSLKNLSQFCNRVRHVAFPEIKTKYPLSSSSILSGPLWKDPTVWTCVVVGGALIVVQGIRIGLFSRIMNGLNSTSTPLDYTPFDGID